MDGKRVGSRGRDVGRRVRRGRLSGGRRGPPLKRRTELEWVIEPRGKMRVPGLLFASEPLVRAMDHKVFEQVVNVATLPGIRTRLEWPCPTRTGATASRWGESPPSTPTRASSPRAASGFDTPAVCGACARGSPGADVEPRKKDLADALFRAIPAGVGSRGRIRLSGRRDGPHAARRARAGRSRRAGGRRATSSAIEEGGADEGRAAGGRLRPGPGPACATSSGHSAPATTTWRSRRSRKYDAAVASAFGLREGQVAILIHSGSRGWATRSARRPCARCSTWA